MNKPVLDACLDTYQRNSSRIIGVAAGIVCLTGGLLLAPKAHAITSISQGFLTNDSPALGAIVSLQKDSSDYVNSSNTSNVDNIIGVVVEDSNSLLSLSTGQANQVQVATSGVVQVLVSNINGDIHVGDQVTSSPINGVGMKANTDAKVVGIAQGDLEGSSNNKQQEYTDQKGQKHTVLLGEIPVLISVSYYFKEPNKTLIPATIQNLANAMANKTVKPLPIIVSLGIFLVTIIVVVTIIYAVIHSSIISVGRNPMSQAAIYRNLVQLAALVVAILITALLSIFMVLTRF